LLNTVGTSHLCQQETYAPQQIQEISTCYAARSTRPSISLRSVPKSIGLVRSDLGLIAKPGDESPSVRRAARECLLDAERRAAVSMLLSGTGRRTIKGNGKGAVLRG
jgi:hypothetical protein